MDARLLALLLPLIIVVATIQVLPQLVRVPLIKPIRENLQSRL